MGRALRAGLARTAAAGIVAATGATVVAATASAQSPSGCSTFAVYSAVGSAVGTRVDQRAPGVTIFDEADGNLPAAQAQVDSIDGSIGWAGAPYSEVVSDNIGVAGGAATPNDVPVFAVSSFPAEPHQVEKSTPGGTLGASSGPDASSATAVLGGASSDSDLGYGVTTTAAASCTSEGTLEARAESTVSAIDIGGVLRIGSIRSTASVVAEPGGGTEIEGTVAVEGVTVAGQPVGVSDDGLVFGPAVAPLPANPLAEALSGAGISVRFLEAIEDEDAGQVIAPGVEITVAQSLPGVGSGPVTTRYVIGQAFARASFTSMGVPATPPPTAPSSEALSSTASSPPPSSGAISPVAAPAPPTASAPPAALDVRNLTARLADWSILPAYSALATGGLLFLLTWLVLGRLTARYRWT